MKASNIFVIACLVFILAVFFVSPWLIKQQIPHLQEGEGVFTGKVIKEPDRRSTNTKLTIQTEQSRVLVTVSNYPEYQYGDVLEIRGKLQEPMVFEDFNYKEYLAKEGIYLVVYYPGVEILEANQGNFIYQAIFKFKNKIKQSIEQIMPFPEISILEAITLGNKQMLSDELKETLNITGTRHIMAISGMHIIILSEILLFLLIGLGLWRQQAVYFALGILILFIIMVGAPASAIRAGIMGGILLIAQSIGRLSDSGRIVVFAAVIMLIFNPLLLRYDVGFQLSFLAVLGIIYLKPIFDNWLEKVLKKEQLNGLVQIITMTLAAQIAVLPILIYNFGKISFISPIANVLIVPTLPFIMSLGLAFNISALFWPLAGKVFIWPTYIGLTYVVRLTEFLSRIPFAAREIINIHWLWLIGYYILLISFIWFYQKRKKLIY
jgi:competence protein ComEC